jgi:hypothetical protein
MSRHFEKWNTCRGRCLAFWNAHFTFEKDVEFYAGWNPSPSALPYNKSTPHTRIGLVCSNVDTGPTLTQTTYLENQKV